MEIIKKLYYKIYQFFADWKFTFEVLFNPELKKMFRESEKRGPSKISYSADDVFNHIISNHTTYTKIKHMNYVNRDNTTSNIIIER